MAFSATARDSVVAEMNITPLVDVMLVLLVIFMVSAPLMTQDVSTTLPQRAPPVDTLKPPQLRLEIADDGSYRLDGRLMGLSELGARLEDSVVTDPRTVLDVHATSGADYQGVVSAMAEARNHGVVNLSLGQ